MKISFIVGPSTPDIQPAMDLLKGGGYTVLKTETPDEIDQTGKQSSKVILVFEDPKYAYKFCQENRWHDFKTLKVLYLLKRPILTPEVSRKLSSVGLEIVIRGEEEKLKEKIQKFEAGNDDIMELEFSITSELDRKRGAR